jgi:hypothetical protein
MMLSLFLLFGILQLMVLFRIQKGAKLLFFVTLLLSLAVFYHHVTTKLDINL